MTAVANPASWTTVGPHQRMENGVSGSYVRTGDWSGCLEAENDEAAAMSRSATANGVVSNGVSLSCQQNRLTVTSVVSSTKTAAVVDTSAAEQTKMGSGKGADEHPAESKTINYSNDAEKIERVNKDSSAPEATCGPDQVLYAERLWATKRDEPVRLRTTNAGPAAETPVSIVTLLRQVVARSGDHTALAVKVGDAWKTWTYQQYYDDIWKAAKALIKLGLEPHNGVAILGFNSPEWFISDLAAIFAGGLATGIYTTNSAESCQFIADSARCNVIVVENDAQLRKIRSVWPHLPHLKAVVQYAGQPTVSDDQQATRPVYSWSEFMGLADSVPDSVLHDRVSRLAVNTCCTLIYTSGTTGNPKGVMLSHDNLVTVSRMSLKRVELDYERESIVSYLPLSHVAAQVLDIYIPLHVAATVYFAQPDALKGSLAVTMREVRPTAFLGVPRIWEKMQEKMQSVGAQSGFIRRSFIRWARSVGLSGNRTIMNRTGWGMPFGWSLAQRLVFSKVRAQLGLDRCKMCMTAAAPISRDTLEFFQSFDLPVFEIFGMSESTGPHTVSTPDQYLTTSAGTPIPGSAVHILNKDADNSGEICMSGRNVFMGYLDDEQKTREAIDDDGLLHSGDIGRLDRDGFLFVTGRIKELLITAGGENVAPVPIEDNVKEALPCVSNCMLVGDARKFLAILLTLKTQVDHDTNLPLDILAKSTVKWFQDGAGASPQTVGDVIELCGDTTSRVRDVIQAGIDRANRSAPSRAQTIQKWTILPRDFSIAGDELGPTLKVKRPNVSKLYASTIDSMYAEVQQPAQPPKHHQRHS